MLTIAGISPHPPIIIPAVGRDELNKVNRTVQGLQDLCRRIGETAPERLIIITPHGPVLYNAVALLGEAELSGDFGRFGAPEVKVSMRTDRSLLQLLEEETAGEPVRPVILDSRDRRLRHGELLDHGAAVPLYYLQEAGLELPGLHLTFGLLPLPDLYRFGRALRRAVDSRGLPTALVASGDLSHRLTRNAPAGYNPRGEEFDRLLVNLLREKRIDEILGLDPVLVEEAGECGLRSFIIALGALDGEDFTVEIISYEGPFGVGYLVAAMQPASGGSRPDRQGSATGEIIEKPSKPVRLARQALHHFLEHGRLMKPPLPVPTEFTARAGAFVSLKKDGELRGCIGTVEPVCKNLAEEIISNAVSAAVKDPRFDPVSLDEIEQLTVSVDVLSPVERVSGLEDLDPKKYGVLVRSGFRSGLLLPDLEGIDTAEEQVAIARRKAGISPGEPVDLYRFSVKRYT